MVATQLRASAANKLAPMIFSAKRHVSFALLFLVVGGAIGFLGWHGQGEYGYALLLFGAVLLLARNAAHAFVFALGYYLLLSTETPPSLRGFFDYSLAASVGLWLAHGALNAVAWALPVAAWALLARFVSFPASMPAVLRAPRLVWTARALFVLLGGSILSVLEPWASFSWGHPLMVAGQMYPGGHWFALAAVLLIWIALGAWAQAALDSVGQPRPATRLARAALLLPLLLPIAILASMLVWRSLDLNQRPAAEGFAQSVVWHAQHSQFEPGRTSAQLIERSRWVRETTRAALEDARSLDMQGLAIVFGEGVVGHHRDSITFMFASKQPSMDQARALVLLQANRFIENNFNSGAAIGAGDATIRPIVAHNALWAYGYSVTPGLVYISRRPVPWASEAYRVLPNPQGSTLADLGAFGKAMIAICYEGFLMEHWLKALIEGAPWRAQRVVAVANLWFLRGAAQHSARAKQELAMRRGAGLLGLPLTFAINAPDGRAKTAPATADAIPQGAN